MITFGVNLWALVRSIGSNPPKETFYYTDPDGNPYTDPDGNYYIHTEE